MENDNVKDIGPVFSQKEEMDKTEIDFTEDVTAKKLIMKPFVKAF